MSQIINLFPLSIYKSKIEISKKDKEIMAKEVFEMEKNSKNPNYKKNNLSWTGDTQGYEYLNKNPKFKELFSKIKNEVIKYVKNFDIDTDQLDFYIQRSWATISRGPETIQSHIHGQSHITFAYYLKKEKKDSKITFYDSHKHNEFITGLFGSKTGGRNVIKKMNALNASAVNIEAEEDDIVIFPSKTFHGTGQTVNVSNNDRISIAADISIFAKDSTNLEQFITPINEWEKF